MEVKLIELRDRGTFIPMIAVKPTPRSEQESYLLGRAGYGCSLDAESEDVLLARLGGGYLHYDPHGWVEERLDFRSTFARGNGTYSAAHDWLLSHWDEIKSGDVLDVEYVLGETTAPKESERLSTSPGD